MRSPRQTAIGPELNGKTLLPGMPVETFIDTGSRTAFAYCSNRSETNSLALFAMSETAVTRL